MRPEDIPKTLLEKYPQLVQIDEAIRAHLARETIDTRCPTCDRLLVVTEVSETGGLWVACGNGCTAYHEHYGR